MHLIKHILLVTACTAMAATLAAQRSDSLNCGYDHSFTWQQAIAPASLITAGSVIAFTPLHTRWDMGVQEWLQHDGHAHRTVEDGIQYSTLAAVPLLKVCGLESRHGWRDMANLTAGSCLVGYSLGTGLKYAFGVERPNGIAFTSFPSGHTLTAFLGAELLRREYGEEYPVVAIAGYAVATGVGAMRLYNDYHWCSDVLAGAGLGILSASMMYWLAPYLRF